MIKSSRIIKSAVPIQEPLLAALRRFRSAFLAGSLEFFIRTNLTIPQCRALDAVGRAGRMSGRQLAAEMEVSPAAIVSLCDRLERDGYLRRVPDSTDRRVTWFELTAAGDSLLDEIVNVGPARVGEALSVLTPEELQLLVKVLDKLAASVAGDQPRPAT